MSNSNTDSNKFHGKPCVKCGSTERQKNGRCAPCSRAYVRQYYKDNRKEVRKQHRIWRNANLEEDRAASRRWNATNPERHHANSLKWNKANPERVRESQQRWRKANLGKIREARRKWEKDNPESRRSRNQRRRARKLGNESEPYGFKAICAHYDNCCVRCGKKKPLSIDHIKPVSKGGPDIASNIQPLCQSCNSTKGIRNIDYRPDIGPLRWIQRKLFG